LVDLILQALLYMSAIADDNTETDEKVNQALQFLKEIALKLDVRLSDTEIEIITIAIKLGFIFIGSLGVKTAKIKYHKAVKYIYK
jgi:hypothetical protein